MVDSNITLTTPNQLAPYRLRIGAGASGSAGIFWFDDVACAY